MAEPARRSTTVTYSAPREMLCALADTERHAAKETERIAALEALAKDQPGLPSRYLREQLEASKASRRLCLKWRALLVTEMMGERGRENSATIPLRLPRL